MIIACINFYNEIDFLEKCLCSLKSKVDKIVCVDGVYKNYPHGKPFSTDGSLEIARQYADVVIETDKAWQTQQDKRNQYFIGKDGDYYLIIDADEILEGDIPELSGPDCKIMLHRTDGVKYPVYRIIKHREGLKYWGTHHAIWVGGKLLNKKEMPVLQGCRITHLTSLRGRERIEAKGIYYRTRKPIEADIRKHFNI